MRQDEQSEARACLSLQQFVVFAMAADPEPDHILSIGNAKRTVVKANTHGPVRTNSLEMQRRVSRIAFQQFEITIGKRSDMRWQ
ncbi:hypothetical protein [Mesorhizobium sp. IMUNJ 23232]|uniref:hypothetical protein n=1 Tax=Mesorhizobium sp. IMUNJ 23232 TaxID=3376064 RepID=UPI0037B89F3A